MMLPTGLYGLGQAGPTPPPVAPIPTALDDPTGCSFTAWPSLLGTPLTAQKLTAYFQQNNMTPAQALVVAQSQGAYGAHAVTCINSFFPASAGSVATISSSSGLSAVPWWVWVGLAGLVLYSMGGNK